MSKIDTSQWQEFELVKLFNISSTKGIDRNKVSFSEDGEYDFIGRQIENNGIQGRTHKLAWEPYPPSTFSLIQVGNSKALFRENYWYASQNLFILEPLYDEIKNRDIALFIQAVINKIFNELYGNDYNSYPTLNKLSNIKVLLPAIEEDVPDWDYMTERIKEMEAERIKEMEAYLAASGLDNTELTDAEKEALSTFDALLPSDPQRFKSFPLHTLFDKIATRKLPYKAGDLAKEPFEDSVPVLTASNENQGLTRHIDRTELKDDDILSNKIVIIANGDCTAFYQSDEFAVLQDAYALEYLNGELDMETALYLTGCLQKLIKTSFNWNNKAGWNKIKDLEILLPVTDEGDIDYEYIHHFEGGVIKETISRVNSMRMQEQSIAREIVNS